MIDDPTRTQPPAGEPAEPIGAYRLLQKIGEGGMGEVWLAEQMEPIRRRVALKLIKAGMDTKQFVARFEAERQALALMDHPTIAKVFDAGETPRGLPYFVMEYVKGEPITAYCDRLKLLIRERLELFREVCQGVQHAHQKGIIHRDLKPSNVLITVQGEKPVPKIIDFGVAKATAQRLTEKTMYTELGVLIGTPEYMSPEQAEMTGLDVDTRTDVYALGVILYELLTGALPFDPKELRAAGFDEIRRRIREVDPPRPSTKVRSQGEASTESARRRRTEPGKLVSRLQGELDWITMKALEKDRTRRYGSPNDLAADIERHLSHQPVLAGPPSAAYRTRKFVRRHRIGAAAAVVVVVALAGFGVTMAMQAQRIAKERTRAERVSEFLTDLFKVSDPSEARGNTVTAREILDRGAEKIDKELANEPEVQAQLMVTMGAVYTRLGLYDKAEPVLNRAVETRRRILGEDDPETLAAMEHLAFLYERQGRYAEAEKLGKTIVETQRRVLGEEHPDTLLSMERLGVAIERQGRYVEAQKIQLKVLEARRRVLGENHNRTIWSMNNVAAGYEYMGRYVEAEKLYRQAFEARRQLLGIDHPDTLWIMNNLGNVAVELGKYDEAEKLLRDTYEARRRVLGEGHPDTLGTLDGIADVYLAQHREEDAEKLHLQVLETSRRLLGADNPNTLAYLNNLANFYSNLGRFPEAEKVYLRYTDAVRRTEGPEHSDTLAGMNNLAFLYTRQGKYPEAEKLFSETLAIQRRVFGDEYPDTLITMGNLAPVLAKEGRYAEAEKLFLETMDKKRRVFGETNTATLITIYRMGCACALKGRRAEALDWIRQAVERGYQDAERLAKDPDCQSLHGDPEFERLVAQARK